jgi:hypothetical protein
VDRRFPVDANAATQPDCAPAMCHANSQLPCAAPAGAAKTRKSACAERRHHVMAVRFGSTPFPHGCWDRPIGIGVRARARARAGWRGRRERRGAARAGV